jgi:hypothetical protein
MSIEYDGWKGSGSGHPGCGVGVHFRSVDRCEDGNDVRSDHWLKGGEKLRSFVVAGMNSGTVIVEPMYTLLVYSRGCGDQERIIHCRPDKA